MKNEANDAGLQVNEIGRQLTGAGIQAFDRDQHREDMLRRSALELAIGVQQSRGIGSSTDVLNEARSFFGFLKGDAK